MKDEYRAICLNQGKKRKKLKRLKERQIHALVDVGPTNKEEQSTVFNKLKEGEVGEKKANVKPLLGVQQLSKK